MKDNQIAISAEKVYQSFQVGPSIVPVLKNVNFTIREKSFNVIYGASGSGKSTLLNILTGLQPPTHGTVIFNGLDVYKLDSDALAHFRAGSIGFIYQQNFWVQSLSAEENVAVPLFFLGYSRAKAVKKARKMLQVVGMSKAAKRNPTLLSSGEQQRVAVARAIISDPDFIVADEPTGSLDTANGDNVIELLHHSQVDLEKTVIMVTHNMEYLPLADNLLHIKDGHVRQMPEHAITQTANALLSNMKQRIDRLATVKHEDKRVIQ